MTIKLDKKYIYINEYGIDIQFTQSAINEIQDILDNIINNKSINDDISNNKGWGSAHKNVAIVYIKEHGYIIFDRRLKKLRIYSTFEHKVILSYKEYYVKFIDLNKQKDIVLKDEELIQYGIEPSFLSKELKTIITLFVSEDYQHQFKEKSTNFIYIDDLYTEVLNLLAQIRCNIQVISASSNVSSKPSSKACSKTSSNVSSKACSKTSCKASSNNYEHVIRNIPWESKEKNIAIVILENNEFYVVDRRMYNLWLIPSIDSYFIENNVCFKKFLLKRDKKTNILPNKDFKKYGINSTELSDQAKEAISLFIIQESKITSRYFEKNKNMIYQILREWTCAPEPEDNLCQKMKHYSLLLPSQVKFYNSYDALLSDVIGYIKAYENRKLEAKLCEQVINNISVYEIFILNRILNIIHDFIINNKITGFINKIFSDAKYSISEDFLKYPDDMENNFSSFLTEIDKLTKRERLLFKIAIIDDFLRNYMKLTHSREEFEECYKRVGPIRHYGEYRTHSDKLFRGRNWNPWTLNETNAYVQEARKRGIPFWSGPSSSSTLAMYALKKFGVTENEALNCLSWCYFAFFHIMPCIKSPSHTYHEVMMGSTIIQDWGYDLFKTPENDPITELWPKDIKIPEFTSWHIDVSSHTSLSECIASKVTSNTAI